MPATDLSEGCYFNMFGFSGIEQIPDDLLPALEVPDNAYTGMFASCAGLTIPMQKLPALTVGVGAYAQMFAATDISRTPYISVQHTSDIGDGALNRMFSGCSNLSKVFVNFDEWDETKTEAWLAGVAETGNFISKYELEDIRDTSHIPEGWHYRYKGTSKNTHNTTTFPGLAAVRIPL